MYDLCEFSLIIGSGIYSTSCNSHICLREIDVSSSERETSLLFRVYKKFLTTECLNASLPDIATMHHWKQVGFRYCDANMLCKSPCCIPMRWNSVKRLTHSISQWLIRDWSRKQSMTMIILNLWRSQAYGKRSALGCAIVVDCSIVPVP